MTTKLFDPAAEWRTAVHKYTDPKIFLDNLINGKGGNKMMVGYHKGFSRLLKYLDFNVGRAEIQPQAVNVWDYHFGTCTTFRHVSSAVVEDPSFLVKTP